MTYPSAVNLPYNGEIIRARFTQRKPGELDETAEGYWAFLQGDALLLADGKLYHGDLPAGFAMQGGALIFGEWDGEPIRLLNIPAELALPDPFCAVPSLELPDDLMTLLGLAKQIQ